VADYAIGDVQGCYDALQNLLDHIHFSDRTDRLWFVGDLVNRGPQSLQVLRFLHALPLSPYITLGNHDLHLLSRLFVPEAWSSAEDSLTEFMKASDAEELGHWLRKQSMICHSPQLNVVMCHAGIAPIWDLEKALALGEELQTVLHGEHFKDFLSKMYGNEPHIWSDSLSGMARLRVITNSFTRMRCCNAKGALDFTYTGSLENIPKNLYPWFATPHRKKIKADIVFGHWAALMGKCPPSGLYAIDTGCFWGGQLTALRLQDKQRFLVHGEGS
jgi:bis(5'-nucleosyl)-tetraphosphatase (symmetrical)